VVVCEPALLDAWLQRFDKELANIGVTKGGGLDVKSTACSICQAGDEANFASLDAEYVRHICKILAPSSACEYLGTKIGGPQEVWASFMAVFESLKQMLSDHTVAQPSSRTYTYKDMC
jgi:hypothetical protein